MKTAIPLAILAALAGVHAQGGSDFSDIGQIVSDSIESGLGEDSGEAHAPAHSEQSASMSTPQSTPEASTGSHHSPAIYAHSHPPMAQAERRAYSPDTDTSHGVDEGNTVGGTSDTADSDATKDEHKPMDHDHAPVPTCSTLTEHVVKTVTQTVTADSHHHHSSPAAHVALSPESSSAAHIPAAPVVVQTPGAWSTSAAMPMSSSANMAHGTQMIAVPASSSVHGAMVTSSALVHGAASAYSVIPVHVPMASSSHSSIKLHGSNAMATPSSSAGPSGADANRAHGTSSVLPSSLSFTGAGAQLAPNTGIMAILGGLMGLMAFVL